MKYIHANGVATGAGGMNYGSGIGEIPAHSLAGLQNLGSEISGAGMLGQFGSVGNFGTVGLGQQDAEAAAAAMQQKAEADAKEAQAKEQQKLQAEAEAKKKKIKYLLFGAGAIGLGWYLLKGRNSGSEEMF